MVTATVKLRKVVVVVVVAFILPGTSNVKLSLTAKDSGSTRDGEGRLRKWSSRSLDSETDFNQQNSILLTTVTELNGKILQLEAKLFQLVYTCENQILVYTLNKQLPFCH